MKKYIVLILAVSILFACKSDDDSSTSLIEEIHFTGAIEGCSDFSVTKLLNENNLNTILRISGSGREDLNLTETHTTFSLPNNELTIEISEWDNSVSDYFCNDVPVINPNKLKSWNAISGEITIAVSNIEVTQNETTYEISLQLENVVFESTDGTQVKISNLLFENVFAGWLPG